MCAKTLGIALLLGSSLVGCGALRSLAGRNTVDLQGADVRAMGVDIRKQNKTICPRERVQMAVFADVVLKGERELKKLETWQGGPDANRNGKMEFDAFAFHSEQGSFDDSGWFTPNPDVLVSAAREYELKAVYRARPDKFSFSTSYKPDYRCITAGGAIGDVGSSGASGPAGTPGQSGTYGSSTSAGGNGGDGQPGGNGGHGGPGASGPSIEAYATYVKTSFYEKLVALRIEGSARDLLLFHPEQSFSLRAVGGPGGDGGSGGKGGDGGSGGGGNPAGAGGRGAQGGNGGNGGNGGPGGSIRLYVDERFPELAQSITLDVSGGPGGAGGSAGPGGSGGSGGSGQSGAASGADGTDGPDGQAGSMGSQGPNGTSSATIAPVAEKFSGLSGIELL